MSFIDVIAKKRDGQALSQQDIEEFIRGVSDTTIPDYQVSALLMAIVLRGMTDQAEVYYAFLDRIRALKESGVL